MNVFNNQDRIKHAWPDHILKQTPSLTYGVVYVFGNMTSAVKVRLLLLPTCVCTYYNSTYAATHATTSASRYAAATTCACRSA